MPKKPKDYMKTEHIPHIRIEPGIRIALEQYSKDQGVPLSTAVHDIVATALIQAGYLVVKHKQVKPAVEALEYINVRPAIYD